MPKKLVDALTDVAVRHAKPGEKDRKVADGRGLYLLITTTGGKLWRMNYRLGGKQRTLAIGEYPTVDLKEARRRTLVARDLVRQGIDPVQAKREEKARRVNAALQTFAVVAEAWMQRKTGKWTEGHLEQTRQSMEAYVYPKLGKRAIGALTAPDVTRVLEPLSQAGKLETLRRVRQRVGSVFSYAVQCGYRTDNPVRDLQDAFDAPKRTHFASIKPKELPEFLRALNAYPGHPSTLGIFRMILWTACRTGEVRGAKRDEFDLDAGIWTVPADRMKKRRAHVVPLPTQAVVMLRELQAFNVGAEYMFPSPMSTDQAPSDAIVLQALRKMGYGGKLTGHGLRAAVATGLEEIGYPIEVIKAQLSHAKENMTDAAYFRGAHFDKRKDMMQAWADYLDARMTGASVTPLKRSAA